jgi:hypothetical protein
MTNENNKVTIETDSLGRIIIAPDKLENLIEKKGMASLAGFICDNGKCYDLPAE